MELREAGQCWLPSKARQNIQLACCDTISLLSSGAPIWKLYNSKTLVYLLLVIFFLQDSQMNEVFSVVHNAVLTCSTRYFVAKLLFVKEVELYFQIRSWTWMSSVKDSKLFIISTLLSAPTVTTDLTLLHYQKGLLPGSCGLLPSSWTTALGFDVNDSNFISLSSWLKNSLKNKWSYFNVSYCLFKLGYYVVLKLWYIC